MAVSGIQEETTMVPVSESETDYNLPCLPRHRDETTAPARAHVASLGEICVKSVVEILDEMTCWITGMTVLIPDIIVLTDWYNKSIKLIDVNSKSIKSRLSLGTKETDAPWDITSTTITQVAVTVPDRQHIQFISVSDKLNKTAKRIKTDGLCFGICCHQDKLVVTYKFPAKLEILDMEGRVITTVTTDSAGADVFHEPNYVHANRSSIFISDEGKGEVIMLNWEGRITGKTADVQSPRGLAMLADGSLFVCEYNDNQVHHVSGDCAKSRLVLKDVQDPYALCVDNDGHKLYISRSSCNNNDMLRVYKC